MACLIFMENELTEVEAVAPIRHPSSLDLRGVEEGQRAVIWKQTAGAFFPGLSVREITVNPSAGSIRGTQFGPGQLWTILSPPLQVSYSPRECDDSAQTFSVMLQLEGTTTAVQNRRSCRLRPREVCMIDGLAPFELAVSEGFSQLMVLQMPRQMVLARYPYLERRTAEVFDPGEPGATLLANVLLSLLDIAPYLENDQCAVTLVAIAQLLGAPKPRDSGSLDDVNRRVRAALACIDSQLADPTLNACRVAQAQGISRRRLDEILLKAVGTSIAAQIWQRRLTQAANDLLDPRHASRTVTQIAFSVGFEDAAHFTRAFKRRYDCTPREWRAGAHAHVGHASTHTA